MLHLGPPQPTAPTAPTSSSPPPPPPAQNEGSAEEQGVEGGSEEDITMPDHVVHFHVNPGVTVTLQVGDSIRVVKGPITVPMVPTVRPSPPPMPMPVQVPVGHMVQQIVDETGQLRHVILSPQHVAGSPGPPPRVDPGQPPQGSQSPADFYPGFYAPNIMPPHPHSHPPPHLHPSPPPPPSQQLRDERSSRQYHKLRKRLDHKHQQQQNLAASSSPPLSPNRKPPMGSSRRSKERPSTSRTGRDNSNSPLTPSDQPAATMILSVGEVQQTKATISWATLETSAASTSGSEDSGVTLSESSNTMYQLFIGKKGPDGQMKSVYFGPDFSHGLDDLTPGTEYTVKLSTLPVGEGGTTPSAVLATFLTPPAPPAPPPSPKLLKRTKTTLSFKWGSSTCYGSAITQYNVEICEEAGTDHKWRLAYSGKERQCTLSKLNHGQMYRIRINATNQLGTSDYGPETTFSTSFPPPAAPGAPMSSTNPAPTPSSICVCWVDVSSPNSGPVRYTLEMAALRNDVDFSGIMPEELTGKIIGGFMRVFHGTDCQCMCTGLSPATNYLLRLRVEADEGPPSSWSHARLATPATTPGPPPRPQIRGRTQPQALKLRWEPPHVLGGAKLVSFLLQIDDGAGYKEAWSGLAQETLVSGLVPGHTYSVRVAATNESGQGPFSDPLKVTTAPSPPGPPSWAKKQPAPMSHSLLLVWDAPFSTGGAPISQYEVDLCLTPSEGEVEEVQQEQRFTVYKGIEARCDVHAGISPATKYTLWVRACNSAGIGPWSNPLCMETAVAPPCAPEPPIVTIPRGGVANVCWENLALAASYHLEMAMLEMTALQENQQLPYEVVFSGPDTSCEVKRLLPGTSYMVRLQGLNSSGAGQFSAPFSFTTPLSTPGVPPHAPRLLSMESDGENVAAALIWEPPSHWGGDVEGPLNFQLEISIAGEHSGSPQVVLCQENFTEDLCLALDTSYRVRVRAANSVGLGPLSSALRLVTPPPPPPAPKLHLAAAMPKALRLSWEPSEDQFSVCVEIRRGEAHEFHMVYEGSELSCKVQRLREDCEYQFRASARGKGGEGPPGAIQAFRTLPAPKPIPRGLKILDISSTGCTVQWQTPKTQSSHPSATESTQEMHSLIQMSSNKTHDYVKVYRGPELKYVISNLTPVTEYWVRAAFVSPSEESDKDEGPFCPPVSLTTCLPEAPPVLEPTDTVDTSKDSCVQHSTVSNKFSPWILMKRWRKANTTKKISEQQKAFIMDIDGPSNLKRSSSAPMINELNSVNASPSSRVNNQRDGAVFSLFSAAGISRTRRFSASCSPLAVVESPRLSARVTQLRREERLEAVRGRELEHERELHCAMQMSQSCEDLALLPSLSQNNNHHNKDVVMGRCSSPSSPSSSSGGGGGLLMGSHSPTRSGGRVTPTRSHPLPTFLMMRGPLSPSPTRKAFTSRRSLSPIAMRPSALTPVKRKFEMDNSDGEHMGSPGSTTSSSSYLSPPAKRLSVGTTSLAFGLDGLRSAPLSPGGGRFLFRPLTSVTQSSSCQSAQSPLLAENSTVASSPASSLRDEPMLDEEEEMLMATRHKTATNQTSQLQGQRQQQQQQSASNIKDAVMASMDPS